MANGYYEDGTITVALSGTAVTGAGTAFATRVRVGDKLTRNGFSVPIVGPTVDGIKITSNTALTLAYGFPAALTGATYKIELLPDLTRNLEALEAYLQLAGMANVEAIAGLDGTGGDKGLMLSGAGTATTFTLPASARVALAAGFSADVQSLLNDASFTAMLTSLGLSANGKSLVTQANYAAMRNALGLEIGTDVQAFNAKLAAIVGLTGAAGSFIRWTGASAAVMQAIVGTVSQSSGVSTGAIVERGTVGTGDYVRFADGTQICWKTVSLGSVGFSASGGLFVSAIQPGGASSAAFAATPVTTASIQSSTGVVWAVVGAGASTSTFPQFYLMSSSASTSSSTTLMMISVGRWF